MGTINKAMLMLAEQQTAVFIGQGVRYGGVATYKDLDGIPESQRIEMPVAEELQMGISIGLAIQGYLPISIFPRCDFLLRAMDQLVNHLDKLAAMSCGQFVPKVIIRTRVGGKWPLDAGPQHTQDHTEAMTRMLTSVAVCRISEPERILPAYREALDAKHSSLIVEALG